MKEEPEVDNLLYDWMSSFYGRVYTDAGRLAERKRRVDLGQFVMQSDSPGGSKKFRVFESIEEAYEFIVKQPLQARVFYETIFDAHPRQKPYFDIDIIPTPEDPMSHRELLTRLLTEIKRVVGPELDLVDDISVYSSHAPDGSKHSYHVVLTGYHVHGNVEAGNFAKTIQDGMVMATSGSESAEANFIVKCIDLVVYKILQQFRILGCTKMGKERYKAPVLEYEAAGRTRIRFPSCDPKVEFYRSLLSYVEVVESKYLDPKIYARSEEDRADSVLRTLCSKNREMSWSKYEGDEDEDGVWFKESAEIMTHLFDQGHLPGDLTCNLLRHRQKGTLVEMRAPPAGGYSCIVCERHHEHENPYLTLREDYSSSARTEEAPRVIAITYHCRRDPTTTMRICSMRGGGATGVSSFSCSGEHKDPRIGEKTARPIPPVGSSAVDV